MKLIRMNIITSLFLFSLILAVSAQAANQIVFFDDFESYAADVALPTYPNSIVPVGLYWYDYLTPSNDTVSTAFAKSGTKSLRMVRDQSLSSHLMALSKTTGAMADGKDLLIKQDVYLPSASNTCENYYLSVSKGGWTFDGAHIKVLNASAWVNTGITPDFGSWNTIYAVLHLVQKSSSPITWGGTYDMYLIKADGSIYTLGEGMGLVDTATGDSIARLHLYAGYASEVYYDNITMTGDYVAQCGDVIHPIPVGDLNEDCRIDFTDFAQIAANWMTCTPVACQ